MRTLLALAIATAAGCSPSEDLPTCEEAFATLATCTSPDQAECADDSPAGRQAASEQCQHATFAGKADYFGNRVWGDACTWNWQCQASTGHTCNAGACYLRSAEDNACDRGD